MATKLVDRAMQAALSFAKQEALASKHPIAQQLAGHVGQCQIEGCQKFGIGGTCGDCLRTVCTQHGYIAMTLPPRVVCGDCVALEAEIER